MFDAPEKTKKTDAINGAILTIAGIFDVDWYPQFYNRRSHKRVIKWLEFFKLPRIAWVMYALAFTLTYGKDKTQ